MYDYIKIIGKEVLLMRNWLKVHNTYNFYSPINDQLIKKLEQFKHRVKELNFGGFEVGIQDIYVINDYEYCIYILLPKDWDIEDSYVDKQSDDVYFVLTINDQLINHKLYKSIWDLEVMIFLQELNKIYNSVYNDEELFHLQPFIKIKGLIDDLEVFNAGNVKFNNDSMMMKDLLN